jgi:predicted P-loop ATPase
MLVLEGKQGTNKSTALKILAVHKEWFSDDLPLNADGKRVIEGTQGHWIIEAAELKGMRKGETEALKSFLSRTDDHARLSYDRLTSHVPRQSVIFGTTNHEKYLKDVTGNRRFWPARVGKFKLKALRRNRDQLWAEAAYRESQGESTRLNSSLWDEAEFHQGKRLVDEPFVDTLREHLGDYEGKIRAVSAWKILGIEAGRRSQYDNERLSDAMRQLGWKRRQLRFGGNPEGAYVRGKDQRIEIVVTRDKDHVTVSRRRHGFSIDGDDNA